MDTADMETDITVMGTGTIMEMGMETVLIPEITTETKRQVIHILETMEGV